jgi:hypothetical protein
MKHLLRLLVFAAAAAALLTIYYFASSAWMSGPIEASVVDASTGQPVSGAIVLANWELSGLEGYVVGQLAVFEVVTDANGAFRIPAWGPRLHTGSGEIRARSPQVRILDRRYVPVVMWNSPGGPLGREASPKHLMRPSLNGQTVRLQAFRGTPAEYVQQLRSLQQSVEFLYSGGHCEWQQAPRTVATLHKIKSELGDAASSSNLFDVNDIAGPPTCGRPVEFLKEYLQ